MSTTDLDEILHGCLDHTGVFDLTHHLNNMFIQIEIKIESTQGTITCILFTYLQHKAL